MTEAVRTLADDHAVSNATLPRPVEGDRKGPSGRARTKVLVFVLLAIFCIEVLATMRVNAPTVDELTFVTTGYYIWRTGDFSLNAANPIFLQALLALPLLPMHLALPPHPTPFFGIGQLDYIKNWQYAVSFYELNHNVVDQLTYRSRLVTLALSLVLGIFVFLWSKELYGDNAGLFSLFLYVFSPTILAFSGLSTLDMGGTCFAFIALYAYTKLMLKPSMGRLLATGTAFAVAMLSKPPTIFLIPIFLMALLPLAKAPTENWAFFGPTLGRRWRKPTSFAVSICGVLLLAFLVVNLTYGFQGTGQSLGNYFSPLPSKSPLKNFLKPKLASLPLPFPSSLMECVNFMVSGRNNMPGFLMGRYSFRGWWYYHLFALLIKEPIPMLLFLIALVVVLYRSRRGGGLLTSEWILVLASVIYFGAISFLGHALGYRHVIPAMTFLFVLLGKLTTVNLRANKLALAGFVVLCAWLPVESLRVAPHYIPYFNELIGGPDNGYKYLVDSNLDWGQDLKGLKQYMVEHQIQRIKLGYFGSADPAWYGIQYDYLPSVGLRPSTPNGKWWIEPGYQETCAPTEGVIAISANILQGINLQHRDCYAWLRQNRPVAIIGHSIFVYSIPEQPATEINR